MGKVHDGCERVVNQTTRFEAQNSPRAACSRGFDFARRELVMKVTLMVYVDLNVNGSAEQERLREIKRDMN